MSPSPKYTGYGHYVFPMMVDKPPFDNVDVRTALKYAINREEITKKIFLGHAKAGQRQPDRARRQIRHRSEAAVHL